MTDVAFWVAVECGSSQLLTVGVALILHADCIYETPPDVVDPCLALNLRTERTEWQNGDDNKVSTKMTG